jgi:uncharacterized membrane protein
MAGDAETGTVTARFRLRAGGVMRRHGASASGDERRGGPSAWLHRLPVIALALAGCGLATYLTLYQWHLTTGVWDPIFGAHSSEAVLESALSRALPVPDATLGAFAYLVEAILGALGGRSRWSARPWLVIIFGLVVAGLAVVALALVLSQVFLVRAFCTLCLCSAAISFINAWLAKDEVRAAAGYLWRRHRTGQSPAGTLHAH